MRSMEEIAKEQAELRAWRAQQLAKRLIGIGRGAAGLRISRAGCRCRIVTDAGPSIHAESARSDRVNLRLDDSGIVVEAYVG